MNKLFIFLLVLLALSGCDKVSKDLAQAPNNNQIGRYGLDHIKLGLSSEVVLKKLNSLIKTELVCKQKNIALDKIKRNFILKDCELPKQDKPIKFWNEKLKTCKLRFLDNKLINLTFDLKTSGDYKSLYNKHGKRVLNALGKPAVIDLAYVRWQKQNDEATLEDKGHGIAHFVIQNKKIEDYLSSLKGKNTSKKTP